MSRVPRALHEYIAAVATAVLLAWLASAVSAFTGYMFPALLFLMAVVISALRWRRGPVLTLATLGALVWNFLFIPPRFTFHIAKPEDAFMFAIFFLVALSMGHLTSRLNEREKSLKLKQRETEVLLGIVQTAAFETDFSKGLQTAAQLIGDNLKTPVAIYVHPSNSPCLFFFGEGFPRPSEPDRAQIEMLAKSGQNTPLPLQTQGQASLWLPLLAPHGNHGAIGFTSAPSENFDESRSNRLQQAIRLQVSLVVEKEYLLQSQRNSAMLAESERLHRILFDSVSHELKTPVAIIRAALDGLPSSNAMTQEIDTASRRLQRILDDFLDITRVESASLTIQREWTDLADVLEAAKESAFQDEPLPTLQCSGFDTLPPVKIDGRLIARALGNLLHNAAIYAPHGIAIQAKAEHSLGTLKITVRDRGAGIPPERLQTVFKKFFRLPGSPPGGTGLGLAITRGLLKAHDGEVTLSNHPQGGTEATITLPANLLPEPASNPCLAS
jgi:two-component system sensor histidine kinase KdpD